MNELDTTSTGKSSSRPTLLRTCLFLFPILLASLACDQKPSTPTATSPSTSQPSDPRIIPLPIVQATIGGRLFNLEFADTDDNRSRGLMYRKSMPLDHGMLFAWDFEDWRSFWMKNTEIPLDIIYLDKDKKIVSIHQMVPHNLAGVDSAEPAQYAIELNVGVSAKLNLRLGDKIDWTSPPR